MLAAAPSTNNGPSTAVMPYIKAFGGMDPAVEVNAAEAPTAAAQDQHKCHFLDMPAELRNRVYEYAVTENFPIVIDQVKQEYWWHQPGTTRVNRQIRSEALPIFYADNTFRLDLSSRFGYNASVWWIKAIGQHLQFARQLVIALCDTHDTLDMDLRDGSCCSRLANLPKCHLSRCGGVKLQATLEAVKALCLRANAREKETILRAFEMFWDVYFVRASRWSRPEGRPR